MTALLHTPELRTLEVPLVCPRCALVHRVGRTAFRGASIACPHCSFPRATADLVAMLPRSLTRSF